MTESELRAYARSAARRNGIDESKFERQIDQESGFNPNANNASGADGIAQIVVKWHPSMAGKTRDPVASLDYAAALMAGHLRTNNGDWALALSYYNAGGGATASGLAGTLDGWPYAETVRYVANILGLTAAEAARRLTGGAPAVAPKVTYAASLPVIAQNDAWSCAPTSARWALMALGRAPAEAWIEDTMVAEGVVSKADGLLDASGKGLAEFIRRHYGEDGYDAAWTGGATFDHIATIAGTYPVLIGGRAWGHWSAVRMYAKARDVLMLANPGDGFGGVRQEMTRAQFAALGPFSAVRIWHPDVWTTEPATTIIDSKDELIASLRAALDAERTKLGVLQAQYLPTLKDLVAAIADLKVGK